MKKKKKKNFLIGWILSIPILVKIRVRKQERVTIQDLNKQVDEWKWSCKREECFIRKEMMIILWM